MNAARRSHATFLPALLLSACAGVSFVSPRYPETPRAPVVDDYFGTAVADPYRWLEGLDTPQTRAWVEAQNALSGALLQALPARAEIAARLTALWSFTRYSAPQRGPDGTLVYAVHDGVRNQPVLHVRHPGTPAPRVLLDPNGWSADGTEGLADWRLSPDGRHLAYAVQSGGSDWIEYRVLEVATGAVLPDRVRGISFNFDFSRIFWRGLSSGFFYSRFPDPPGAAAGAPPEITHQKLYFHRLGTSQSEDVLVYERPDLPRGFVWGEVTADGRYLVIYVEREEDAEKQIFVKDLGVGTEPRLDAPARPIIDRFDARHYLVGSDGPLLYLRTSQGAPRFRVVAVDVRKPHPKRWREVVAESADVLQDALLAGGEIVATYLHHASSRLVRFAPDGERLGEIALPGVGTAVDVSGSAHSPLVSYTYTSFSQPRVAYVHDLRTGTGEPFHPPQLAFAPTDYVTEQVFVTSKDGTRVPMFLTYRRGLVKNGRTPTLLYGYGGFSIPLTPSFSLPNLVWMERGGIYAQVSLRGGSEYGEAWHRAGMLGQKQNVFDDFIAAAEWLQREGYTSREHLAIKGRSNGGLLVGAVLNQRPELFAAANAGVGVLDMLRYHRFGIAYAWAGDYGTADTPEGFAVLRAYSPVHNVRPADYPAVLVTTADHDDRVHPLHSYKYTAALQAAQTGPDPILIRVDTRAGHGSGGVGTPVSKQIDENADVLAFLEYYTQKTAAPK